MMEMFAFGILGGAVLTLIMIGAVKVGVDEGESVSDLSMIGIIGGLIDAALNKYGLIGILIEYLHRRKKKKS